MKLLYKILFIGFWFFLSSASFAQTHGKNAVLPIENLTVNDSGRKLVISKGEIFTLTLKNQVDGGYRFNFPQYDSGILHLFKHLTKNPAANSPLGYPGRDIWQFKSINKGKTWLKVSSSRPWAIKDSLLIFKAIVISN